MLCYSCWWAVLIWTLMWCTDGTSNLIPNTNYYKSDLESEFLPLQHSGGVWYKLQHCIMHHSFAWNMAYSWICPHHLRLLTLLLQEIADAYWKYHENITFSVYVWVFRLKFSPRLKKNGEYPARSHGNSYIFYEVANSYKFVRPHSIFAKLNVFYELQIRMN